MRQGNIWCRFLFDESGQAITEYGSILAFVSILVALVFSFTNGSIGVAISNCFSAIVSGLDNLASGS